MSTEELEEGSTLNIDFKKLKKISESNSDVIPVVVQDIKSGDILILAYVNVLALENTQKTGMATFWSTSRNELWVKGKTSGDYLKVEEIRVNCEQNSLLYLVSPQGKGACHTQEKDGTARSGCYYRKINQNGDLEFVD